MQLALILALLLLGGKQDILGTIGQLKPVLEEFGDDNIKSALSSVEQISGVINAFTGSGLGDLFSSFGSSNGESAQPEGSQKNDLHTQGYPLKPVSKIVNKNITYALSQYFAEET